MVGRSASGVLSGCRRAVRRWGRAWTAVRQDATCQQYLIQCGRRRFLAGHSRNLRQSIRLSARTAQARPDPASVSAAICPERWQMAGYADGLPCAGRERPARYTGTGGT